MKPKAIESHPSGAAALKVVKRLRELGHEALFAGGCVRDLLFHVVPKDFDVATSATPDQTRAAFRRTKAVGQHFGVILVRIEEQEVEVATFRSDGAYSDGRRPDSVAFSDARSDALRRDFTVNGLFYDPLEGRVIDYVEGLPDLDKRLLRCIGDPEERFREDHLRMLRAARLTAQLGFTLEPATLAAMRLHAARLRAIAPERIYMELAKLLAVPGRADGWRVLIETGLSDHLTPERSWPTAEAAAVHALLAGLPVEALPPRLGWAALFHARAPRDLRRLARALRFSNDLERETAWLVEKLQRLQTNRPPMELADYKILRCATLNADLGVLLHAAATASAASLMENAGALSLSPAEQTEAEYLRRMTALREMSALPPPLLTGDDLQAAGYPPGPSFGPLLTTIQRAQLNETLTSREEAWALIATHLGPPPAAS